jgi:succinate--hydroxymethylglutarate CoA-transferase
VLVENYLPGSLAKYAMDYDTVSKINPGIIYASITGYGQTGPYRNRAGYDVMVEAYTLPTLLSVIISNANIIQ